MLLISSLSSLYVPYPIYRVHTFLFGSLGRACLLSLSLPVEVRSEPRHSITSRTSRLYNSILTSNTHVASSHPHQNIMASQQSPTGPMPHQQHYPPPGRPQQPNGAMPMPQTQQYKPTAQHLAATNESVWLQLGALSELMGELDGATQAYERAMNFNQWSVPAMLAISCILRSKDQFTAAVEYLRQIIKIEPTNGEVWSSLGHCYLMMDDLQQAYSAYQQALYHLPDPKEPKLWYGIGILYDRYGSLEHAEEAFSQVMRMEPNFEKANEIYFRLGIIYKQQQKFLQSLEVGLVTICSPKSSADDFAVLSLYCHGSAPTAERRGHLVSNWPRARTTERCKSCTCTLLSSPLTLC